MVVFCVDDAPIVHNDVFQKRRKFLLADHEKLLIGRGIDIDTIALFLKGATNTHRLCDGFFGNLHIQTVGEKRIKLYAEKSALGKKRSMLLDLRKEIRTVFFSRENDSLAKQCAYLRTADIKGVAIFCDLRKRNVRSLGGKTEAKTRTVKEKLHAVFIADGAKLRKLSLRIQCTVFGRM